MFDFLYQMLGGEHEELPHRRGAPIAAAPGGPSRMGDFVVDHGEAVSHAEPWLVRGEVPGARPAEAILEGEAQSVVDELRQLAQTRMPPTAGR